MTAPQSSPILSPPPISMQPWPCSPTWAQLRVLELSMNRSHDTFIYLCIWMPLLNAVAVSGLLWLCVSGVCCSRLPSVARG